MSVFMLCERAIGLVRGKRLVLTPAQRVMLEDLDYEQLIATKAQEEAVTCVRHFAFVRDKLLQDEPWTFARKTAAPAQLSTPLSGWPYSYALPTDCLKLLALVVNEGQLSFTLPEWEQVGQTVGCRQPNVQARYTALASDTTKWDPAFEDVFCCLLAGEAIAAITGEVNAVEMMEQRAELGLQRARRIGAISPAGEISLQLHPWDEYSRNF